MATLAKVVDYLHLNPVRAKVVTRAQVGAYRWSSLQKFIKGPLMPGMTSDWLNSKGVTDDAAGWRAYESYLITLAGDEAECRRLGLEGCRRVGHWERTHGKGPWRTSILKCA